MKITTGFIGAGKAGCAFGRYLADCGVPLSGYYDIDESQARDAGIFTGGAVFSSYEEALLESDALFLSVPDGMIADVWNEIRALPMEGKQIFHMSGALSSQIFEGIEKTGARGASLHPLLAISDRYRSTQAFKEAHFTLETAPENVPEFIEWLDGIPNHYTIISPEDKVRYHAAAAIVSNLSVGLMHLGESLLTECGFSKEDAYGSLIPLLRANTDNITASGTAQALTGPIERNDIETVNAHLACLTPTQRLLYASVSLEVLSCAMEKNPDRDYEKLRGILSAQLPDML